MSHIRVSEFTVQHWSLILVSLNKALDTAVMSQVMSPLFYVGDLGYIHGCQLQAGPAVTVACLWALNR